jgi:hypothetical protein
MSDSTYFPEEGSRERGIKRLWNKVVLGSTSVASSTGTGNVVTRSTTGTYTLTTTDPFVAFKGLRVVFNVNSTTPTDIVPQVYAIDQSAKTVKFKLLTGTTPTDPATGTEMYIEAIFKDTGVTY